MRSASLASLYRMPAGHLPGCPASWPLNPLARDLLLIGGFAALTHVMRQRVQGLSRACVHGFRDV